MDYLGDYIYINNNILCDILPYDFSCGYSLFRISCRSCGPFYQIITLISTSSMPSHFGDFIYISDVDICLYVTKQTVLNMVKYGHIIKNDANVFDEMLKRKVGNKNFEHMLSWEKRYAPLAQR